MGCGARGPASALRTRPGGPALSRRRGEIGSHAGCAAAVAATTPGRHVVLRPESLLGLYSPDLTERMPPRHSTPKVDFDIDKALEAIRGAVRTLPRAAMFE